MASRRRFHHRHGGRDVEAVLYDGNFELDFLREGERVRARMAGRELIVKQPDRQPFVVCIGEWIVRHPRGHLFRCDASVFERLYEAKSGELQEVWDAIARERQAREDLDSFLRNVRLRRVEPDDDHEQYLRDEIERAQAEAEAAMAGYAPAGVTE